MKCSGCMAPLSSPKDPYQTSIVCEYCGATTPIEPAMRGRPPDLPASAAPAPVSAVEPTLADSGVSRKSRLGATLLALILGGFGAHRFYIGKPRTAAVMLILLILGVVGAALGDDEGAGPGWVFTVPLSIWVIVDLVLLIMGKMKDGQGRPIKKW